jgi:flotillin
MGYLLTIVFVGAVFAVVFWQVMTNLIYICSPNEVLVFSGGRYLSGAGKQVGYRIVKGGRALRIPFLERVDRLDLTNMNIEVGVKGAFSRGGIPLNIDGIANVKIAGVSPGLDNALQRLLGKPRQQVIKIAKETLEGYLRGVMASLTPEQVNEDTQAFERQLRDQAGEGFNTLGLTLDNLKIQAISDDQGYLTAVGRIRGAELDRDNRIAEAERRCESLVEQAEAKRRGELAKIQAELNILEAETDRRVQNADTKRTAWVAEQEGEVQALLTRAKAELDLQEARIAQMEHQLEANVVTPARASMEAAIAEARGNAAPIMENGRAQAEALRQLAEQWRQSGDAAKDIFLLQKLETILPTFLSSIDKVRVDNVTMLQGLGNGNGGSLPGQAVATIKALEAGGIDVPGLLDRLTGGAPAKTKKRGDAPRLKAPEAPKAKAAPKPKPKPKAAPAPADTVSLPSYTAPPGNSEQPKRPKIQDRRADLLGFQPIEKPTGRPAGKAKLIRRR